MTELASLGAITLSQREFRLLIDSLSDAVVLTDAAGIILMVNRNWERVSGITRKEIEGRNVRVLVREGYYTHSVVAQALSEGQSATSLLRFANGTEVLASAIPVRADGVIKLVICSVQDVIELEANYMAWENSRYLKESLPKEWEERSKDIPELGNMVAHSAAMQSLLRSLLQVAKVDSTVLFTGESGTGKTFLARLLHSLSPRSGRGRFLAINCAAVPATLLESELFGYEGGAFTGARREGKTGLVEAAQGGTLLLDEIAELPLELQPKLLEVLQSKTFVRIGSTRTRFSDVRFICATNRNLEDMVKAGRFREDLYWRINVLPVYVPTLSERREDIAPLANLFLERLNTRYNMEKKLAPDALRCIQLYSWPGNIRELENTLEQLAVLTPGNTITLGDLPPHLRSIPDSDIDHWRGYTLKEAVRELERQIIEQTVASQPNLAAAAQVLGIDVSTLTRKRRRYRQNNKHKRTR
ncbi:MAG: sigma 54-interacting transcriptional regulator [Firmicutes bacterium]|nr:sigma 54-interacting transcriptional regulator [Bacillota bacterium]